MAGTFDFAKVADGVVKLKVGDAHYSFLNDGSIKLGDAVVTEAETVKKAAKEFAEAAKAASVSEIAEVDHVMALRGTFKSLATRSAEEVKGITGLFNATDEIEAILKKIPAGAEADASVLAELRKVLVAHPEAKNLLDADAHNLLNVNTIKRTVDGAEKVVRIVDFPKLSGEIGELRSSIDSLVNLHSSGVYDEAAVKKVLASAPEGIKDVIPAEVQAEFLKGKVAVKGKTSIGSLDLNHIAGTLETEIAAAKSEALQIGTRLRDLQAKASSTFFKGSLDKQIEQVGGEFDALVSKNPDIRHHINTAMEKAFTAEERAAFATVKSASAAMGSLSSASKETSKSAKWITGGKWNSFTHTVETAAGETAKIGKFRWGKAAIIGLPIAGIVAYFLAGTGNRGPGDRAADVERNRGGEPAVAR